MSKMLSIRVVSTLEEFGRLAAQWDRLLEETSSNNIFLTWEWLYTWAKHYMGENKLFILLASEGDRIVGIAPLYIRKVVPYQIFNLRQLEFLGTGEACSSYLDFIIEERKRKQVLHKIYHYLYGEARKLWDVLYLAEIPVESPSIDILYESIQDGGKVVEIAHHTCCPVIRLAGSVEDFLNGISGNERYHLRRKSKRLQELGHVEYYRASLNGDVQKEFDTFVGLHQKRWVQKGSGGCFKSQRFLGFHREVSGIFSKTGRVHLDFLSVNGQNVAGIYGYSYNGSYYFYLPGLDPAVFSEASPGILLLFECICQAIRGGCKEFDLLRGPADYKTAWANDLRRSLTLRVYNRSLRSVACKLLDNGKEIIKVLVR